MCIRDRAYTGTTHNLQYRLRDPDGTAVVQTATYQISCTPITLPTLLAAGTTIRVAGDYALVANANGTYTGAAFNRARINGVMAASALTASNATFPVGNTAINNGYFQLDTLGLIAIPAAEYIASLRVVAAAPTVYSVSNIDNVKFGSIVRNGTELQAPLAQVPTGWLARMVLTNTCLLYTSRCV